MQHHHIRDGELVACDSCPPPLTAYTEGASIVDQTLESHRRYRQLLRDMTPKQFVEYCKAEVTEQREQQPEKLYSSLEVAFLEHGKLVNQLV